MNSDQECTIRRATATVWLIGICGACELSAATVFGTERLSLDSLFGSTQSASFATIAQAPESSSRFVSPPIAFPPVPSGLPAVHPPRQIVLVNGDRLTGEIISGSASHIEVRWFGQARFRIPLAVTAHISSLPGERDVLSESFASTSERGVLRVDPDSPFRMMMPNVRGDFRCSFRVRVLAATNSSTDRIRWSAQFSPTERLQVECDPRGLWRVESSLPKADESIRQLVAAPSSRWQTFRLQRTGQRIFLSVENSLLYAGSAPAEPLSAWEIENSAVEGGSSSPLQVDHVSLVAVGQPPIDLPDRTSAAEAIVGAHGETWWGRLHDLGPEGVTWKDAETTWRRSWSDIQGVVFRTRTDDITGRELTGQLVSLRLQPTTDRPDLPGDQLTAVLASSRDGWQEIEHPLLGRLSVPIQGVQRIERRLLGRWKLLDALERALGDHAHSCHGQFSLPALPTGRAYVSLEASGLEPSGPATPPGSPTLKSLRAGHLVTELFINEHRIGNFNELTSDWSLPGKFDRLRLVIPRRFLKAGHNAWRISQQPGNGPRPHFDDCRIRNVALEVEVAWP